MLQTVRSVVGPASAATERRHLEYFSAAAAQAAAALQTPDEPAAHQRLVELIDELRLAHNRARRIDVEAAVRMSMSLHWFGGVATAHRTARLGREAGTPGAGPARPARSG